MLPGTIIMLIVIVVGFFGGTVLLIKKNLSNEKANTSEDKPAEGTQEPS